MNNTYIQTKARQILRYTVLALTAVLFALVMATRVLPLNLYRVSPNVSQRAILAHTERETVADSIFTPAETIREHDATVNVVELSTVTQTEPEARYILTDEEKRMLCYVADNEDFTSVESRQAVMQVVMNRVESDKFPGTITDVLYQKKQFAVMKRFDNSYTPSDEAVEALERLLYGGDIFDGECALFFANKRVEPHKIAKGLYLIAEIGGSKFWGQE